LAKSICRSIYTSQQWDESAQMYYLRARYYNPSNGLFNRVDPYSGNTQDPQSLHKYLYVHGNPVNNHDHSGLSIIDEPGGYPYNWTTGIMAHVIFYVIMSLKGGFYDTPVGNIVRRDLIGAGLSLLRPDGIVRKGSKKGFYELKPITNMTKRSLAFRVKMQMHFYDLAFSGSGIKRGNSEKLLGVLNGKPVGFVRNNGSWYMVKFYAGSESNFPVVGSYKGLVYYSLTKIDYKPPRGGKRLLRPIAVPENVKENIRIPQLAPITISIADYRISNAAMMSCMWITAGLGMAVTLQSLKPGFARAF